MVSTPLHAAPPCVVWLGFSPGVKAGLEITRIVTVIPGRAADPWAVGTISELVDVPYGGAGREIAIIDV